MGNTTVNPTQRAQFFFTFSENLFLPIFFFFMELAYDRRPAIDTVTDDAIVWGACQVANHSPERPTYGRPMAGSYTTVSSDANAIASD